ncbi:MAG TPA: glycosyltransferase family 4 protein [Candidatus Binatia bacterium]
MTDGPLRFCMVTTFYPPYSFGGDGVFVHRLANELGRRGHRVDVIHCKDAYRATAGREPERGYDDHPNVTAHGLESPFGRLSPLATQQTGRPLFKQAALRRVLEKGFDVIHFHNISLLGPAVLKYGRGIKLYTMHEYWLVCPTHVLFRFNRAACERPYCFACTLVHKRPPQWWRYTGLLESAVRHVDAFIAPGRFSREKHRAMGFTAPIAELPPFAGRDDDPPGGTGPLPGARPEKPYFLFVGRLEKLKGLQTLIPVFRNYPRARLLIAGAGDYEPELRRMAGGGDNVRFLGHCAEERLDALYRGAVAVVVPSLCFEGFPLVLVEAFRQQTPVIARAIGGLTEVIGESGGGSTYRTEQELLASITGLLEDPARRQSLGRSGYEAYRKSWTVEAHMSRYFALIRETAAKAGREAPQASLNGVT